MLIIAIIFVLWLFISQAYVTANPINSDV